MENSLTTLARYMRMADIWADEMHRAYINASFYARAGNEYKSREFAVLCAHYARLLYPQLH
jgi:hypothetical protein